MSKTIIKQGYINCEMCNYELPQEWALEGHKDQLVCSSQCQADALFTTEDDLDYIEDRNAVYEIYRPV